MIPVFLEWSIEENIGNGLSRAWNDELLSPTGLSCDGGVPLTNPVVDLTPVVLPACTGSAGPRQSSPGTRGRGLTPDDSIDGLTCCLIR